MLIHGCNNKGAPIEIVNSGIYISDPESLLAPKHISFPIASFDPICSLYDDAVLYIGTRANGLWQYKESSWTPMDSLFNDKMVTAIHSYKDVLYVAADSDIYYLDKDNDWKNIPVQNSTKRIWDLHIDQDLLILAVDEGLISKPLYGGEWSLINNSFGQCTCLEKAQGQIFAGCVKGISRYLFPYDAWFQTAHEGAVHTLREHKGQLLATYIDGRVHQIIDTGTSKDIGPPNPKDTYAFDIIVNNYDTLLSNNNGLWVKSTSAWLQKWNTPDNYISQMHSEAAQTIFVIKKKGS